MSPESMEVEIATLKRQVVELQRRMKLVSDWHNTVRSPWYKTVWWFCKGYRVRALGTWYVARWNKADAEKYNKELG